MRLFSRSFFQTEQQNLDTLLAGEMPPELREAVTEPCARATHHDPAIAIEGPLHDLPCTFCGDYIYGPLGRAPLLLDPAIVAAMRWCRIVVKRDVVGEAVEDARYEVYLPPFANSRHGFGTDIFAAIGAALKGGE